MRCRRCCSASAHACLMAAAVCSQQPASHHMLPLLTTPLPAPRFLPLHLHGRCHRSKQPVIEPRESAAFNAAAEDFRTKIANPAYNGAVLFAVTRCGAGQGGALRGVRRCGAVVDCCTPGVFRLQQRSLVQLSPTQSACLCTFPSATDLLHPQRPACLLPTGARPARAWTLAMLLGARWC